jgi:hypothetical protein
MRQKSADELVSASAFIWHELKIKLLEFLSFFLFDFFKGDRGINLLFTSVPYTDYAKTAL